MPENRNAPNWEEHKNQPAETGAGSKQETESNERPGNRLNDGTNDFENGDQEPTSEKSSKPDEAKQQ